MGATSVSFRYDQNENSLEPTYLEQLFSDWKTVNEGCCPVCRNHTVLVKGFPVVFKASFAEPSKAIADVYELVYHITGKLTTDWEGQQELTPARAAAYAIDFARNPNKHHEVVAHSVAASVQAPRGQKAVVSRLGKLQHLQFCRVLQKLVDWLTSPFRLTLAGAAVLANLRTVPGT